MTDEIIAYEKFNVEKAKFILANKNKFRKQMRKSCFADKNYDPFGLLQFYINKSKNGIIKVPYYRNNGQGRLQSKNSLSMQKLSREIRNTIADNFYIDIDMVNCHATILNFLCKYDFNFKCSFLNDYINRRDIILDELISINSSSNKEDMKQLIISIFNGKKNINLKKTEWLEGYINEIENLVEKFELKNHSNNKRI